MTTSYFIDETRSKTVPQISKSSGFWSIFRAFSNILQQPIILLRRLRRRARFVALLNYDDHMIEDMGLTRAHIEEAAKLPLKFNAALIARTWARRQ